VVLVTENSIEQKQLVTYVVSQQEDFSNNKIREYLQQKLPAYMVPSAFVMVETLPLTPNGKIDRKALANLDISIERQQEYLAPQTEKEQILVNIWQELLSQKQTSIYDNFFEIGGDSILSIQMVSRAKTAGVHITPKQIFQYQTIAELSKVADTGVIINARQGVVTGMAHLTPIQHWFWSQQPIAPHHYNQSVLLQIPRGLTDEIIVSAAQKLLTHHDALRLSFPTTSAKQQQINRGLEEALAFSVVDLSTTPIESQAAVLEASARDYQAGLDLSQGLMMQMVKFDLGGERDGRLLIIIHHLAVDGVSWRILLSDLETIYQQLTQKQAIKLSQKTTAFIDWAQKINDYAQTEIAKSELGYWLNQSWDKVTELPVDHVSPMGKITLASTENISVTLNKEETKQLLGEVHKAYRTQINDILLAGLALTIAEWTGNSRVAIDLEGHGRESLFEDIDLSRTVGWFTSLFPILLNPESLTQVEIVRSIHN